MFFRCADNSLSRFLFLVAFIWLVSGCGAKEKNSGEVRQGNAETEMVDFDSLSLMILADAVETVNATANLTFLFLQSNSRLPAGIGEILTFARLSDFPFNGRSRRGWWIAGFDTSLVAVATSTTNMPRGAGKMFVYNLKSKSYTGYGLTSGAKADAVEDSLRITRAFALLDSLSRDR